MSSPEPASSPEPLGWSNRVAYGGTPGNDFAYTPGEVIVNGQVSRDVAVALIEAAGGAVVGTPDSDSDDWFRIKCTGVDVLNVIEDLRVKGIRGQPNFVFFAHDLSANSLSGNPLYGNPLYGNPLYGNPLYGNPLYGNPLYGNPLYGNPLYGNPLYGNPLYGNPLYGNPNEAYRYRETGIRPNSARPAEPPITSISGSSSVFLGDIFVLDSGLGGFNKGVNQLPPFLLPVAAIEPGSDSDVPDSDGDDTLDVVAGHGTFITGIIERRAPGRRIVVRKVFQTQGDVDERKLGLFLDAIPGDAHTFVNLSLGGYATDDLGLLPQKLRKLQAKGTVIVASAGNDGSPRPLVPAALKDVVSVGALGAYGPAWFSNYGPWVRACAPGVEVLSSFFNDFNGPHPVSGVAKDPDYFKGWAYWSGTSFAAPAVVAALSREMARVPGSTAKDAVERLIDAPGLFRLPGLGTVVNI